MIRTAYHPTSGILVYENKTAYTYSKSKKRGFNSYIETRTNKIERIYRVAPEKWVKQTIKSKQNRRVRNTEKGDWQNPFKVDLESGGINGADIYYNLDKDTSVYSTAVHEAGHFLADIHEGRRPKYATIIPEGDSIGHVRWGRALSESEWKGRSKKAIRSRIFTGMAGAIASNKFLPFYESSCDALYHNIGARSDLSKIEKNIELINPDCTDSEFQQMAEKTERWVNSNISKISNFADQLLKKKKITREDYLQLKK